MLSIEVRKAAHFPRALRVREDIDVLDGSEGSLPALSGAKMAQNLSTYIFSSKLRLLQRLIPFLSPRKIEKRSKGYQYDTVTD